MRALGAGLALAGLATPAVAQDAGWEPGNRTTSRVRGEIEPRDDPYRGDGVYGRFRGDLDLGLGLGTELDQTGGSGALRASLHYFSTVGVTMGYADALGRQEPRFDRVLSAGVELRPLFLPRFVTDASQGPPALDLFLDSIALGVGAYFATPPGEAFGARRGVEASVGFGLPLAGSAPGPWLEARGLARLSDPRRDGSAAYAVSLTVSWHTLWASGLTSD